MTCHTTGTTPIAYTWHKDGRKIEKWTKRVEEVNTVDRKDAGRYRCSATNVVEEKASLENYLDVYCTCLKTLLISIVINFFTTWLGTFLWFPLVVFYLLIEQIQQVGWTAKFIMHQVILYVWKLVKCLKGNLKHRDSPFAFCATLSHFFSDLDQPTIIKWNTSEQVLQLACLTRGHPTISYQWFKGNTLYGQTPNITIDSIKLNYGSVFKCVVTNSWGVLPVATQILNDCKWMINVILLFRRKRRVLILIFGLTK